MRTTSFIAALLGALLMAGAAENAKAGLFISVSVAPPPLVVYVQPPVPGPGYIWTPGYWAWDEEVGDYYWVPGAWVAAPEPGLVWTPGYWGWSNGVYVWSAGYWGPHVGFYGGIDYGFGYSGVGFAGGYWAGGAYYYNRSVTNTGRPGGIVNVYSKGVPEGNGPHIAFNGGNGGVKAQPTAGELAFASERHIGLSGDQLQHQQLAGKNPDLRFSKNHGKPAIAATAKAGDFSKGNIFAAKSTGGALKPSALRGEAKPDAHIRSSGSGNASLGSGGMNHNTFNNRTTNLTNRTTGANYRTVPDRFRPDARTLHRDAGYGNPPRGAAFDRNRRPGPPQLQRPGPRPAGKQPPKNNNNNRKAG